MSVRVLSNDSFNALSNSALSLHGTQHPESLTMTSDRTIGIVDTHASVSASLSAALARAGYMPCAAYTFGDAIALMAIAEPAALIVSLELGAFNGLHVLLRSAVDYPSTRVVVVGPAQAAIEDEARALGAAAYVARPLDVDSVVDLVNSLLLGSDGAPAPVVPLVRHA